MKDRQERSALPPGCHVAPAKIGDDLGRLDNELAKLALSAKGGKIAAEQIADGVAFQRERQMSELTNAVAAGRPAEAIKRWRQLVRLDPSTEFRAVTWLAIWLSNIRKALAINLGRQERMKCDRHGGGSQ